jgi:hypothetical protein
MHAPGWKCPKGPFPALTTGPSALIQLRENPAGTLFATLQETTHALQSMHLAESITMANCWVMMPSR